MEPSLEKNPHYHKRHHNFITQSLLALNKELKQFDTQVYVYKEEVITVLERIAAGMNINTLFSMQETGIDATYMRDKFVKKWCVSLVDYQMCTRDANTSIKARKSRNNSH